VPWSGERARAGEKRLGPKGKAGEDVPRELGAQSGLEDEDGDEDKHEGRRVQSTRRKVQYRSKAGTVRLSLAFPRARTILDDMRRIAGVPRSAPVPDSGRTATDVRTVPCHASVALLLYYCIHAHAMPCQWRGPSSHCFTTALPHGVAPNGSLPRSPSRLRCWCATRPRHSTAGVVVVVTGLREPV